MPTPFVSVLNAMPTQLADALAPFLTEQFDGALSGAQLSHIADKSQLSLQQVYLALLPIAAKLANPPISHFHVGALVIGGSGNLYMGANLELPNQALNHSVHAEQSAISHAWIKGETEIKDIIVNASPCGHCRQFINELHLGKNINIHLPEQDTAPLSYYLPYAFGPSDLGVTTPLLHKHSVALTYASDDKLVQTALEQASISYAPYSACHAAVVLEMKSGEYVIGRYAENAAFNPSLLPMQMALSHINLRRLDYQDIQRAVLVESSAGQISLADMSQSSLASVSNVKLESLIASA
ncbi:cytidine deaminase [Shewanella sp. SNU WT4]|uniref:cytidine deaminase n=1 Tax=Shewanella sp. SNU WT4 TaxID=2590015 RepID=UPI001128E490|nr:cytidine deaminase [Shewanella sp. SNU WT4]QDF66853.1 cytidine deaminase [Shewanella sp. SNU WT4]